VRLIEIIVAGLVDRRTGKSDSLPGRRLAMPSRDSAEFRKKLKGEMSADARQKKPNPMIGIWPFERSVET